jgi:hypothetical protein
MKLSRIFLFSLFILLIFLPAALADSTQYTFTTTTTFTVPAGVNFLSQVQMIGGGGSGDAGTINNAYYSSQGAGAFAGQSLTLTNIPVIPGQTYNIVIGAGDTSNNEQHGGSTSAFGHTVLGGPSGVKTITGGCYNTGPPWYNDICNYQVSLNHTVNGDNGIGNVQVAQNGQTGNSVGGIAGIGYGAGGGGGGTYGQPGGYGAYGAVIVTYDPSSNAIWITGYVQDAQTGAYLSGSTIQESELGNSYTTTSDVNGYFAFSDPMTAGFPITLTTSLNGYTTKILTFTSQQQNALTINQTLILQSPSISGVSYSSTVMSIPYNQPINGATLHIVNATASLSATTNSAGYAVINNLKPSGLYQMFATSGATNCTPVNIVAPSDATSLPETDLLLGYQYQVIINVKDYLTNNPISTANITDDTGTKMTSYGTGSFVGDYMYGSHSFTAQAPNYYQNTQSYTITANVTETILLQGLATNSSSSVQYTTPHDVRIHVRSAFSGPVANVNVTASYIQQSAPSSWLDAWYSILVSPNVNVQNTVLSGNTGTDGTVNFLMIPSIQYLISAGGDSMVIYPTDDDYTMWIGGVNTANLYASSTCGDPLKAIQISVAGNSDSSSSTTGTISVTYNDTLSDTSAVNIWVNQTSVSGNRTSFTTLNYTQVSGQNNFVQPFTVSNPADQSYSVIVSGVSLNCGVVTHTFDVTFPPAPISMGFPSALLPFLGFGMMIFCALLFTRDYPGECVIGICLIGWITFLAHWYDSQVNPVIMGSALAGWTFIAIVYNIVLRARKPPVG